MTFITLLSSTHPQIIKEGIIKTELKKTSSWCMSTYFIVITYKHITKPIILRYTNSLEPQIDLNTIRKATLLQEP